MSALSPVLATSSGAPWADPLTPLDSALTDCCLSYKQNAPVSPLESALTNASHLLDSAHFKPTCFDTLARTSPVTPLESALTKTPGMGAPQRLPAELRFRRHMRHVAPPSPVASVGCTWRLHPLWPQWVAHTSCHHGGVLPLRASDFSAFAATPIGSSFVFINLQIPFPATLSFHIHTNPPGVSPCNEFLDRLISVLAACPNPIGVSAPAPTRSGWQKNGEADLRNCTILVQS